MIARAKYWKTGNTAAVVLAIIASAILLAYSNYAHFQAEQTDMQRRAAALPDRWFVVRNVAVPDFVQGSDPLITYSREVREPFIGDWIVEVHKEGDGEFQFCYGSGRSRYEANEELPSAGVLLSWFIGAKCDFTPGKYFLDTTWTIRAQGYPEKTVRFVSNPFTVLPRGAQLFVTPQQAERLAE